MQTQNPFAMLIRSRKFLIMVLDVIISVTLYFVGHYASAQAAEDVKFLIVAIQPVAVVMIGAIAYEDAALSRGVPRDVV